MAESEPPGSNKRYQKMPTFVSSSSGKNKQDREEPEIDNLAIPETTETPTASGSKNASDDDEDDDMEESSESEQENGGQDVRPDEPDQPRAGLGAGLGHSMPPSFGQPQKDPSQQKHSLPSKKPTSSFLPKPKANLTREEQRHFDKLAGAGGIGFKMLSKMGWSTGTGLGAGGEGRVNPVDSQQRPVNMGIGYQGFKEKTKQSKQEAKRRGEVLSDDEEEKEAASRAKGRKQKGQDQSREPKEKAWKAPKPKKRQVQHMSYEEILAQQSADQLGGSGVDQGLGQIIDMTGAEVSLFSNIINQS